MLPLMMYIILGVVVVLICVFEWRKCKRTKNCFLKMACTGKAVDPPLSKEEIHNILRERFDPSIAEENWNAIVIGSGLSGLTVAKVLAAAGQRVLVLEQHDCAGGSCHTFKLDQYEFDVGLHYVQNMYPGRELYRICSAITDSQVQWQKMEEPFDTVIIGNRTYGRTMGNKDDFRDQLKSWFPKEAYNIDCYFDYVSKCLNIKLYWLIAVKLIPPVLLRLLYKMRLIDLFTDLFKYCELNLLDVMMHYKLGAEVQTLISYYFVNYGVPPNRASFFQHHLFLMETGYYPIGGATQIIANAIRSIQKLGGKVVVKADVQQIVFVDGAVKGVLVKSGPSEHFIPSTQVISTASIIKTFNELIPQNVARKSAMYEVVNQLCSLETIHVGGLQAYIGLKGTQDDLRLPSNNYFWFKSNNIYEIDYYLSLPLSVALEYGCPPFIYISFPSAKDPEWNKRHPGISTCQLISLTNPVWFEHFKNTSKKTKKRLNHKEYTELKYRFGEMIFDQLLNLFPNIKQHVAFVNYSSPLTQQYYMQNSYGEYYSLTQQIDRFKFKFWSELRWETDLSGLYLSGQDVLFCGIGSVLHSGLRTACTILKRDLYKDLNEAYNLQMDGDRESRRLRMAN